MTKAEYVRLSPPEKVYGQKNLLHSQLEMLHLVQSFQRYRVLRNEELVLRVTFKNLVEQAMNMIDKLERLLPKAHYKAQTYEEKKREKKKTQRRLSLNEEIQKVREKLVKLKTGAY